MSKFIKSSALAITIAMVVVVVVIVAGCSSGFVSQKEGAPPPGAPTGELVQSNTGGSVTIDVKWIKTADDFLIFDVSMDTHSIDLDQYELGELAVLRDDTGNKYRPVSWDSAPGGHHRQGTLTFPRPDSLKERKAKYIEIVIQDVAGIKERVLRWQL